MSRKKSTQLFFVPVAQIATFEMAEYRARLRNYVQLPNVAGSVFVVKFQSKVPGDVPSKFSYAGDSFFIEIIEGDLKIEREKFATQEKMEKRKLVEKALARRPLPDPSPVVAPAVTFLTGAAIASKTLSANQRKHSASRP